MIYQRLSHTSETSWSAAARQNAQVHILVVLLGFSLGLVHHGRGHIAKVDKNYHLLSQVEAAEGFSSITVTKAKTFGNEMPQSQRWMSCNL